jgi:hypothetical protein
MVGRVFAIRLSIPIVIVIALVSGYAYMTRNSQADGVATAVLCRSVDTRGHPAALGHHSGTVDRKDTSDRQKLFDFFDAALAKVKAERESVLRRYRERHGSRLGPAADR